MAIDTSGPSAGPTGDSIDVLSDYGYDSDFARTLEQTGPQAQPTYRTNPGGQQQPSASTDDRLGLHEVSDSEIKKARAPAPKLDEARLLSAAGIPKLQRISKTRLRFKGKGHEFGDVTRLLNLYQLWLDDLYPKAKFRDGLVMIEKLGHGKRMQTMRRAWIEEGKPRERVEGVEGVEGGVSREEEEERRTKERDTVGGQGVGVDNLFGAGENTDDDDDDALFVRNTNPDASAAEVHDIPPDDDLDMLLAEADEVQRPGLKATPAAGAAQKTVSDDVPDDLDELLADSMDTNRASQAPKSQALSRPRDDFADEMEAMGDDY